LLRKPETMSATLRSNIRRLQTSKNRGADRKLSDGGQGREGEAGVINPANTRAAACLRKCVCNGGCLLCNFFRACFITLFETF
jgi:hypothetical protein